ncbi:MULTISPECIES: hypothetical protein [Cyanophyceae]|uniref:hypothetical protein n=1 Tax=Cyanophyceae TaxID=3028117 RepID=UPI0016850FC1|nr:MULTISPECIES: hypothetical protein [Cyanophyceae]MBD1914851.1 hypothetical protein [Phormidium sp. FACHB-77]MBD2031015.1 hypothetical protein [Phormidium sp. FACHB-322]MBD2052622.1 hypothetical protein [Leptolyngbya sp. FACHB-60]
MNEYQSVSCDFYDELEALATLHRTCPIHYRTESSDEVSTEGQIIDFFVVEKAEYLRLKDGTEIRLDRLISVDGKPVQFAEG